MHIDPQQYMAPTFQISIFESHPNPLNGVDCQSCLLPAHHGTAHTAACPVIGVWYIARRRMTLLSLSYAVSSFARCLNDWAQSKTLENAQKKPMPPSHRRNQTRFCKITHKGPFTSKCQIPTQQVESLAFYHLPQAKLQTFWILQTMMRRWLHCIPSVWYLPLVSWWFESMYGGSCWINLVGTMVSRHDGDGRWLAEVAG